MSAEERPTVVAPPTRFEQLARVVLVLALLVISLAAAFVLPTMADEAPERLLFGVVAVALSASLPLLALIGLWVRTPWRLPVAGTALWFLVLSGLLETATGGIEGVVRIPFLAIAALYVLLDRAPRRVEGLRGWRALATGLGAAAIGWYVLGLALFAPA